MKIRLLILALVYFIAARGDVMDRLVVKTNTTLRGSFTYELSDESRLSANSDYGIALDVGLSSTVAKARIRSVSTIADLVSIDPLTSDIFSYVKVLGYSAAGDGGDGDFRRTLSAGITNAGSITKISTGNTNYAWSRIWDGTTVDAAWFGAFAGDGVADSDAINAAMAYVASLGRGNVQLLGGRYDIDKTLLLPYHVNLIGAKGWKISEYAASISTNLLFLTGGPTMLRLADGANVDMLWLNATNGFIRQPNETIEDGSVVDSRFQDSLIENIIFFGNAANQTKYNLRAIAGSSRWTTTIRNCGFAYVPGHAIWMFDCNAFILDDLWLSAGHTSTFGKGIFVYSSADNFFGRIYGGGTRGPVIWENSASSFKNIHREWLLFNAVRTNTLSTISSWTTNTLANFAAAVPLESGEPVEFRTEGTLPTPFTDTQLYFAVKLATNVYGFHTNYALATNGVYLAGSGSASGTNYLTIGPATALYGSGGMGQNTYAGFRTDQNSGPGVVFRNAVGNFITALEAGENNGVQNGETIPDEDKAAVLFDKDSARNSVSGTIYSQNIGFHVRSNATANVMSAVMTSVSTNVIDTSSGTNYEPINSSLAGTASWGKSTTATALALTGNSGGQRIIKLSRTSGLTQQIGLGVGQDSLNVWNETDGRGIALIGNTGTVATYQFGDTSSATPPTAEIYGTAGSGVNVAGAAVRIYADNSTGNANATDAFAVLTGDAGSSGSSAQTMTSKFVVEGDGDARITGSLELGHASANTLSATNGALYVEHKRVAHTTQATAALFFGDSVVMGSSASSLANTWWYQVATHYGWTYTNLAFSGGVVTDLNWQSQPGYTRTNDYNSILYTTPTATATNLTVFAKVGINDGADFPTTSSDFAAYLRHYYNSWMHFAAYWATPGKTLATAATESGTWTDWTNHFGSVSGNSSTTSGNTLTFTTQGDAIYVAFPVSLTNTTSFGKFWVSIDGTAVELVDPNGVGFGNRNQWTTPVSYIPFSATNAFWALRYAGYGQRRHTVTVTATNNASLPTVINWVAGSQQSTGPNSGPSVFLMENLNRASDATRDATYAAQRAQPRQVAALLGGDGLQVAYLPINGYYDSANSGDGIHPNDTGSAQVALGVRRQVDLFRGLGVSSVRQSIFDSIDIGAADTTLARSAAGVVTIEGVTVAERPTTTALTYSGTNVTLTATSQVLHGNTLTLTNNCLLTITASDGASGGITIVPNSSTSYTVYLDSAIKLLGGGSSFVVTNSASETVNLEWKQTLRGGSSVILANKAVYP